MRKMRISVMVGVILLGAMISAYAAPIFTENFNNASIDTSRWKVYRIAAGNTYSTCKVIPESVRAGDMACKMRGSSTWAEVAGVSPFAGHANSWTSFLIGKMTVTRGNNIRCTFKIWGDPLDPAWGTGPNGPIAFPAHSGVFGPFQVPAASGAYLGPLYGYQEAGIGSAFGKPAYDVQAPGTPSWLGGPSMPAGFATAYNASYNKANAVNVRVWLGNVQGFAVEYATKGPYSIAYDDLGTTPGLKSWHTTCTLGFGTYLGPFFVDDIIIEDDTNLIPVELSSFSAE